MFATYAQIVAGDTDDVRDVYRYDAQTDTLVRVSTGEGGFDPNGNCGLLGARIAPGNHGRGQSGGAPVNSQYEMGNRAVSEDGSRILFTSTEPLSPAASNGLTNAYEWHEGSVSLVNSGSGMEPVEDVVIAPAGNDVFCMRSQGWSNRTLTVHRICMTRAWAVAFLSCLRGASRALVIRVRVR